MNTSESTVKLVLPKRIFKHGTEPVGLERINMCSSLKLVGLVKDLLGSDFEKLEKSFLSTIIKLGQDKTVTFSGKLVNYLLQRRIITKEEELWFTFGEQPMRFSLREFFLTTGLPCSVVGGTSNKKGDRKKKTYSWMKDGIKLKELIRILKNRKGTMKPDEKVRIGAIILVEGILLAQHADLKIPVVRLLRAKDFEEYCSYPWGKCVYDTLVKSVVKLTSNHLLRIKASDWINGYVDLVASREIVMGIKENGELGKQTEDNLTRLCSLDECNEKLDKLTRLVTLQDIKIKSLEIVLGVKENAEQGKQTQEKEVVEEDTHIDSVTPSKKKKRTREIIEEEEDEDKEEGENGNNESADILKSRNIIGDDTSFVLSGSKVNRTSKGGMKIAEDSSKGARENDESTMRRCQTQVLSDDDEEDDILTITQLLRLKKKKYSAVKNIGGDTSERIGKRSRLEANSIDSGPCQKLDLIRDETVQSTEIEQRNKETDETGSMLRKNVVSAPETSLCDVELNVYGSNAEKKTMIDDDSEEPKCLPREDGTITREMVRSDKKCCSEAEKEDADGRINEKVLALKADNIISNPHQKLASGCANGDKTSKAYKRKVLKPSVGDQGQACLRHDDGIGSEETMNSNEVFEKRNNDLGEGDNDTTEKRFQKLQVLALSLEERIIKAERTVEWLNERRAMKQGKIAAPPLSYVVLD
ncbi:hypothetical protein ISN45_Aa01g034860 [Arabidopsis thaliana x Arabidopsis arenosa]|uniref:DUF1985 domain-containing protein n=1 Tax=Arabidopsis thaliana x Arabidopsis arenosa TaxID=1240361 RepID=A0A8T2CHV4_9BRAS|nr:hypothetical protein ISN45_Aa01g034860 [Arabidopsis thaliana x Arabidopsis arenosa]